MFAHLEITLGKINRLIDELSSKKLQILNANEKQMSELNRVKPTLQLWLSYLQS